MSCLEGNDLDEFKASAAFQYDLKPGFDLSIQVGDDLVTIVDD